MVILRSFLKIDNFGTNTQIDGHNIQKELFVMI